MHFSMMGELLPLWREEKAQRQKFSKPHCAKHEHLNGAGDSIDGALMSESAPNGGSSMVAEIGS